MKWLCEAQLNENFFWIELGRIRDPVGFLLEDLSLHAVTTLGRSPLTS